MARVVTGSVVSTPARTRTAAGLPDSPRSVASAQPSLPAGPSRTSIAPVSGDHAGSRPQSSTSRSTSTPPRAANASRTAATTRSGGSVSAKGGDGAEAANASHHPAAEDIEGLHHRLGGADRAGIDLVRALSRDHVGHLLHDLDIARLQRSLHDPTVAVLTREADHRHSGSDRFGVEVAANCDQSDRVGEAHQFD